MRTSYARPRMSHGWGPHAEASGPRGAAHVCARATGTNEQRMKTPKTAVMSFFNIGEKA